MPSTWIVAERRAGIAGFGLAAALVAAVATEQDGPDPSMAFALAFVIALGSLANRSGRDRLRVSLASASGFLGIALLSVYASGFAAIAASIHELRDDRQLIYAMFRVLSATDDASGVFIALFVAAIAYPLARAGCIPHWLARFGLAAAVVRAIGALDVTTLGGLPFAPFMAVGTLLCLIWLLLTSGALCRSRDESRGAPAVPS